MNAEIYFPKKQNVYKGMWYLITNTERFVLIAAKNSMAFELEKEEYQRMLNQRDDSLDPKDHILLSSQDVKRITKFVTQDNSLFLLSLS